MGRKNLIIVSIIIIALFISVYTLLFSRPGVYSYPYGYKDDSLATPQSIDELIESMYNFSSNLLNEIYQSNSNDNILISPLTLYYPFAVLYYGSNGTVHEQIGDIFGFTNVSNLRYTLAYLYDFLYLNNSYVRLYFGDGMWINNTYRLNQSIVNIINQFIPTDYYYVNFNDPYSIANQINNWANKKTNGIINNIISPSDINSNGYPTILVIASALYFYDIWKHPFDPSKTHLDTFYLSNGQSEQVYMMEKDDVTDFNYYQDQYVQAIELPYKDNYAMIIILPINNYSILAPLITCSSLISNNIEYAINNYPNYFEYYPVPYCNTTISYILSNGSYIYQIVENLESGNTGMNPNLFAKINIDKLEIPKFEFKTPRYNLKPFLKEMGIEKPFEFTYDFQSLFSTKLIYPTKVSFVYQQNYIEVNEKGTKAASVTVIGIATIGALAPPQIDVDFIANHPFIFMIINTITNAILFIGVLNNPNSS